MQRQVLCVLFLFCNAGADFQGADTTCKSTHAAEGESGKIECFLRQDIDLEAEDLLIKFKKQDQAGDVLSCYRERSQLKCQRGNKAYSPSDILIGRSLSLDFPNVTAELQGMYELHIMVNGSSKPTIFCDFHDLRRHVTTVDAESEHVPNHLPWAIPLCIVVVVVVVVLLALGYKRCKNKKTREQDTIQISEQEQEQEQQPFQRRDGTLKVDHSELPPLEEAAAPFGGMVARGSTTPRGASED